MLLFVGSGFERKGLATAIDALGELGDDHARMIVIGKGRRLPYEELAGRRGVPDRVVWLGPRRDTERWYGAADVVVLPTRYEPFGNVHLEALASGVPMVTSVRAGGAELIRDGAIGELRKVVVHDGHEGPKEIGVGPEFLGWLTDPKLNGGGALFDFGCYGADLMTYLTDGARPLTVGHDFGDRIGSGHLTEEYTIPGVIDSIGPEASLDTIRGWVEQARRVVQSNIATWGACSPK